MAIHVYHDDPSELDDESPLATSVSEVEYIISLAREFDAKTAPVNGDASGDDGDEASYLAIKREDADTDALEAAIDNLDEDKQIDLVVLMWVGRGTYGADELEDARTVAQEERTHSTSEYLLGEPLLSDYLEEGLAAFGLSD